MLYVPLKFITISITSDMVACREICNKRLFSHQLMLKTVVIKSHNILETYSVLKFIALDYTVG